MDKRKQAAMEALMKRSTVFVHCDPRVEGVRLPEYLKKTPQAVLQFGYNMPVPIKDLCIDQDGVSGVLIFKGRYEQCYLPWESVFAMIDETNRGLVCAESIPPEVMDAMTGKARETPQVRAMRDEMDRAISAAPVAAPPPRNNVVSFSDARARLRGKTRGAP